MGKNAQRRRATREGDRQKRQRSRDAQGRGPGRDPYRDVKKQLRREVGFGCPVADCGSPYLTWHHFDPTWRMEHHHRPEGMIALCLEHAAQADNGAFTDDQLRELKLGGSAHSGAVHGRFEWLRQDVLVRVGGSFYYQTPVIFQLGSVPCIWLSRDDRDHLMINFRMPTTSGRARAAIIDNFWSIPRDVEEILCPPMGRLIEVAYRNGDKFRAEFFNMADAGALKARYPKANVEGWELDIPFPITVVEVWETAIGTPIQFGPNDSRIGRSVWTEGFFGSCQQAIHMEARDEEVRRLFPVGTL